MTYRFETFRVIANIILSALVGLLIAVPLSIGMSIGANLAILLLFSALGALIGYKRRSSHAFFYLSLVSILVLSSVLSRSIF